MNFKCCLAWAGIFWALAAGAQSSVFTYQGQLANGGSAATGLYDLRFSLYDGTTNLIAGPVTNAPVGVTNGMFVTTIDFGAAAFSGSPRALAIGVRTNGSTGAYAVLTPNQVITSTPYAIQSLNSSNAAQLSAPLVATNLAGTIPDARLSTNVALLDSNVTFHASVTASNFFGNGSGLTNISAASLTGTLPDTTLSANVPLFSKSDNFSNNVTAVQFTGSGHGLTNVPGAFFWLTVNGATAQAGSNLGFIVTNNVTPVTITLPTNFSAGDTFRVAGVGTAGWILAQNAGQQVLAGNLAATIGLNWIPQTNSGLNNWTGLASSSDGTKLFATSYGYIYYSLNSGLTWTQSYSGSNYWSSVATSSSGVNLVATVGTSGTGGTSGYVYTSANSGVNWSQAGNAPALPWVACASSADGTKLVAVATGSSGGVYVSSNSGGSWTETLGANYWTGVACSADGTKVVAVGNPSGGSYIYTSTTSGANGSWIAQTNSGLHPWSAVAASADGSRLVATVTGTSGAIYGSANGGVTWFAENAGPVNWTDVASSADGSRLAAVYNGGSHTTPGYVYTSDDSGSTWLQRNGATNAPWSAVACSADGSKLVAAPYGGYIYTSGQGFTTAGTGGYLSGGYQTALELQYVGNGLFIPLSHEGTITAY